MNAPAAVPAGVLALVGDEVRRQRELERRCLDVLLAEGFEPVLLPVLEYAVEETAEGYRFVDPSGRLVQVRTDFTPLAARVLAPCLAGAPLPFSVCYSGEVVRPRPARLRQLPELYQLGFEEYGVEGGGSRALRLTLALLAAAGVDPERCHVSVGVAGLAREILAGVLQEPPDDELVELLVVRDLDAVVEATGVRGATLEALEAALFAEAAGPWAARLGVAAEVGRAEAVAALAREAGVSASLDVAPRAVGAYYRGVTFTVWGRRSRAVVAAGGEYGVDCAEGPLAAAGACLTVGVALEERGC